MNFFLILPNTFLKSFRCHSQGMEGGGNLKDVRCYSFYLFFFFGTSSLNFKSPNIDFSSTWKLRYQRTKVAALFGGWGSEQKYRHFSCQGGGGGGALFVFVRSLDVLRLSVGVLRLLRTVWPLLKFQILEILVSQRRNLSLGPKVLRLVFKVELALKNLRLPRQRRKSEISR